MPIYEFRCDKCQARFEKLCALGESGANLKCPKCGSPAPTRVMSGFATGGAADAGASAGGGCAGCAGGSCATCH